MNKNEAESVIKDTIEYANTEIMKNKKRCFRIVITVIVFAILVTSLIGSCFISYVTFNIGNPFAVASGYFQITVLDKKYVEIQETPKVVLAQPYEEIIVDYMESRGFIEIKDEQMGAIRVFTNGKEKELIWYSINGNYSKWRWQ